MADHGVINSCPESHLLDGGGNLRGNVVIAAFSYKLLLGMLGVTGAWLVGL